MKPYPFLIILFLAFLSCKKDTGQNVITAEQITFAKEFEVCYNGKVLPQLPKKDTYIEGELDGKPFSVSSSDNYSVLSTLTGFKARGYQKEFANLEKSKEWLGNGFLVVPVTSTVGVPSDEKNFEIHLQFSYFRGDSTLYEQYFNQFSIGKTFNIAQKESDLEKFGAVQLELFVMGCSNLSEPQFGRGISSNGIDQTGSYCRIADVKDYKSASGQIFRRDITIVFDMAVSTPGLQPKRIKNGKLFFSM